MARAVLGHAAMKHLVIAFALALTTVAAHTVYADEISVAESDAAGGRLVPSIRDGKPAGYKVYAIKPGSRLASQRFENGDTIEKVDGESVTTDKGIGMLRDAVLAGKADAKVEIQRKGVTIVIATTKKG